MLTQLFDIHPDINSTQTAMKTVCVVLYFHTLNLSAPSWQFAHLYNSLVQVAKAEPATIESAVAR